MAKYRGEVDPHLRIMTAKCCPVTKQRCSSPQSTIQQQQQTTDTAGGIVYAKITLKHVPSLLFPFSLLSLSFTHTLSHLGHVACTKVGRRGADAIGGQAAHQVGQLAQGNGGKHGGGAACRGHGQEGSVHGTNVGSTWCEGSAHVHARVRKREGGQPAADPRRVLQLANVAPVLHTLRRIVSRCDVSIATEGLNLVPDSGTRMKRVRWCCCSCWHPSWGLI
eukprot:1145281-Pelagomonas_calceolata.AAC.4